MISSKEDGVEMGFVGVWLCVIDREKTEDFLHVSWKREGGGGWRKMELREIPTCRLHFIFPLFKRG